MKILIVGTGLNSLLVAQYIKMQNSVHDIYVTSDSPSASTYFTNINMSESDVQGVCDFVKYNQIEFTIVLSSLAIINGIADVFAKEGFPVFAPFAEAARVTFFNSIAKKILYKLKINTPKFGIFDRENIALDYVRNSNFPIVISNDFTLMYRENTVYDTFSKAKIGLQKIFEENNNKIVIENYIDTNPLYIYFVTDGYNALPLVTIDRNSGNGFSIMSAPVEKISENIISNILNKAIYPLLDDIAKYAGNYVGIIGLKIKVIRNNFYILEFYNGFQYYDMQVFISLINEDILQLFYDCTKGNLRKNRDYIEMKHANSYSIAIDKHLVNMKEDDNDFIISENDNKIIFTNIGATLNSSKNSLLEFIKELVSDEIYNNIEEAENKKEIRI